MTTAFDLLMRCSSIREEYVFSFRKLPAVYGISVDVVEEQVILKPYLKALIKKGI